MTAQAPGVRPAQGFSSFRAQRWVLIAAIIVAATYALRRVVEPVLGDAPASGGTAARLAGHGSPPPALAHWAVAYGSGFTFLAILAVGAPEIAASLAALTVVGTVLAHGKGIADDLSRLEGNVKQGGPVPTAAALQARGAANIAAGVSPLAGVPGYGTSGFGDKPAGPAGPGGLG